jgi:tetratricopeptide (TPR) repeat protein
LALVLVLSSWLDARADDTTAAREHYQKGTSYYDLGRWTDAIKEFEAAYEIKNDPALLYNLAQSYRQAGNSEQALHFYRTYLRRVPKAPNRAEIEGRISQLEQLIAQKSSTQTTPPNVTLPPGRDATTPPPMISRPRPPPPPAPRHTTTPPNVTTPPCRRAGAPARARRRC